MKKFKRVLALAMAVILSVPTIITTGMGTVPVKAAGDTVELTVSDDSAKYAGYETHKMYAGGNYAYIPHDYIRQVMLRGTGFEGVVGQKQIWRI